ncbi:MAG: TonB-dependent receptor [Elusimicrobiales bacterium]|nr:TonB-dependent receptor [Elusimicrobiales bacterium]
MTNTFLLAFLGCLLCAGPVAAGTYDDDLEFFREEAKFLTATFFPTSQAKAPASVSVITADDIRLSGARTLWDVLRLAPGVDVIETRTGQGDVAIRGFNQSLSNRVLVLLDGKTVLQDFYGMVLWESIPVSLLEIDRIEIVEGPFSALYGASALQGVVNIITKSPEKINGAALTASAGNRASASGAFLYGKKLGALGYKVGGEHRTMNRFEDAGRLGSRVSKANFLAEYSARPESRVSVSGGVSRLSNEMTLLTPEESLPVSRAAYLRADYALEGLKTRFFWNQNNSRLREFSPGEEASLNSDTYDLQAEYSLPLGEGNRATAGAEYRRNTLRGDLFPAGLHSQNMYSLFLEDTWEPGERWSLALSGRLDRHPLAGSVFSPKASVSFLPDQGNVFRVSAGEAFRNPTLLENYMDYTRVSAYDNSIPGLTTGGGYTGNLIYNLRGNRDIDPEKIESVEAAHRGEYGRVKTSVTIYAYRMKNMIGYADEAVTPAAPDISVDQSWANRDKARAFGAEARVDLHIRGGASGFASYSYFNASKGEATKMRNSPRYKSAGGLRYDDGAMAGMLWAYWAGKTWWNSDGGDSVGSYLLLNARAGYKFPGRLEGLEAGLTAFNLLDNRHYEIHPDAGGEKIGARYGADLTYRF